MKLSLVMIVRDEEAVLRRCLESAKDHVDEIVIVDTGSVDNTPAIAKEYADIYEEMEWQGMAVCRNYAKGLASGDFMMYLDADEWLPDPEHWAEIRSALDGEDTLGVEVIVRNILANTEDRVRQMRVFRNVPEIFFENRIHMTHMKSVMNYVKTGRHSRVLRSRAEVFHTGYFRHKEDLHKKYMERLPVMETEFREKNKDATYGAYHLLAMLYTLGIYQGVLEVAKKVDIDFADFDTYNHTLLLSCSSAMLIEDKKQSLKYAKALELYMAASKRWGPVDYSVAARAYALAEDKRASMLCSARSCMLATEQHGARFSMPWDKAREDAVELFQHFEEEEYVKEFSAIQTPEELHAKAEALELKLAT